MGSNDAQDDEEGRGVLKSKLLLKTRLGGRMQRGEVRVVEFEWESRDDRQQMSQVLGGVNGPAPLRARSKQRGAGARRRARAFPIPPRLPPPHRDQRRAARVYNVVERSIPPCTLRTHCGVNPLPPSPPFLRTPRPRAPSSIITRATLRAWTWH